MARTEGRDNPYASFSVEDLHSAVSRTRLWRRPGKRVRYSNFGGGLLGHALARPVGLSYEELVIERICRPLGMADTGIEFAPPKRRRMAQGHLLRVLQFRAGTFRL